MGSFYWIYARLAVDRRRRDVHLPYIKGKVIVYKRYLQVCHHVTFSN